MKLIFKNKWYYLGTCSALVIVSFLITLWVYNLNAGSIYTTILFSLAILMLGTSFLKNHYKKLTKCIRHFLDGEKLSNSQTCAFRWAFISNIVIWIALFIFLSFLDGVDVSQEVEFLIIGTICIIWLILASATSYYTATRRFVIDFRPKSKQKSKVDNELSKIFSTKDEYIAFIQTIKENEQWNNFCNNMLYRAAIIRKANKKGYFKEVYRIKELRKLIKKGSYYLDRPKDLEIYSDKDLFFI